MNIILVNFFELLEKQLQYYVPKWQRRYSWEKFDIERLVKDLDAISKKKGYNPMHFGGTLITYSEPNPAGGPNILNVVDGQQRLTTIGILLSCIAEKLEETGSVKGKWTSESIRNVLLKNSLDPPEKLRLQDKDDEEYQRILAGQPEGRGKVTEAWRILRKAVQEIGPNALMEGLSRFKVISFPCEPSNNDPQQIFESLNATGKPLKEGEKVKNWLLMGLDRRTQDKVYQDHWCKLENHLDAISEPKRIDEFLRDFLRWKTGDNYGIRYVYTNLRRWWYRYDKEGEDNRANLCKELARLAALYGKITGTNGRYENKKANEILRHLQGLRIDVHRPFTLRLLDDATKPGTTGASEIELIKVLRAVSIWLTRLWLANKPTSGLNTEMARFAHRKGAQDMKSYADYWIEEIRKLRNTRNAVPNKEEIEDGIKNRKAYGGKASDAAKTILYAMNLQLGGDTPPRIEDLSLEHIMPQTLSDEWKDYLGKGADELHGEYLNLLANLTLVGVHNSKIGNSIYAKKQEDYTNSGVMLTRELAKAYTDWKAEDMDLRSLELIDMATECWPWENVTRTKARWRINKGDWREEKTYVQMLLNIVSKLLDLNPTGNSEKLMGDRISRDIFVSGTEPSDSGRFRPIPGYSKYVVNVGSAIVTLCLEMGQRCGVKVDIEYFKGQRGEQKEWERGIPEVPRSNDSKPRWRIGNGEWREEKSHRAMLSNIVSTLLDRDPLNNFGRLSGARKTRDVQRTHTDWNERDYSRIPGYPEYMIYTNLTRTNIIMQCGELSGRCGIVVEVE